MGVCLLKKVVVVTTGGTIAMKLAPATGGLIPAVSGDDLLAAVPVLKNFAEVEVVETSNVPSGHLLPEDQFKIAKTVEREASRTDVDGIVVTHGTDTLEETAYLLDLVVDTDKPICVTGAMRGASDMSWDGPGNILAAVQAAASDEMIGQGAAIVLNNEIHAAREGTKTHSVNTDTFQSPYWGSIGYVYDDHVVVRRHSLCLEKFKVDHLVTDVYDIKCVSGLDDYLFDCLAKKPAAGIVVEAFGCGNVPLKVMDGIKECREHGIPVVLTSRTYGGKVVPIYGYKGSARTLLPYGVILADELTGQKARIKLMVALAVTNDNDELKKIFHSV